MLILKKIKIMVMAISSGIAVVFLVDCIQNDTASVIIDTDLVMIDTSIEMNDSE